MVEKIKCGICGLEKPASDYYNRILSRCKECHKKKVKENRRKKRAYYSEYEAKRSKTAKRKAQIAACQRRRREKNPERASAHRKVAWAIKTGKLVRGPCEVEGCTRKAQAHHDDYSKPLKVRWFCFKHHREVAHGQKMCAEMEDSVCPISRQET